MTQPASRRRIWIGGTAIAAIVAVSVPAHAAKNTGSTCGRKSSCAPSISFTSPAGGATVSGVITVTGSASDNNGVSVVQTSVDGGSWTTASGTTSWSSSVDTRSYADGTHTLYARATDTTGVATTVTETVTFANAVPTVAISAPSAGSTISGTTSVTGSAGDAQGLSRVDVQVDGGAWQQASGTTSWSWAWNSTAFANGSHTVTARATDTSGNVATTSRSVNVSNTTADTTAPTVSISSPATGSTVSGATTVAGSASDNVSVSRVDVQVDGGGWQPASGTTSWSLALSTTSYPNGSHTVTARATDAAGNTRTASVTVNVSNSTGTTSAPNSQGSWTSPEGVRINVNSAGSWTINQVYSILKANAYELDKVGPTLTVNVQDTYASQTVTSASGSGSSYTAFTATIYLKGVNSTFVSYPDGQETHEYGHAWTLYHLYLQNGGSWTRYLNERWSSSDGSVTLATDSRTGTSYNWDPREIIADDYRLLFGTSAAQAMSDLNPYIVDPRQQPGLKSWFVNNWATGV